MNSFDVAMKLLIREFGISMNTLDDRIIAQKKFYLLQQSGVNLGYSFNWYIYGPYSSELTTYLYEHIDEECVDELSGKSLTADVKDICLRINGVESDTRVDMEARYRYELYASLLFWKNNLFSSENNKVKVIDKVRSHKPRFSKDDCIRAYDALVEDGVM